MEKPKFETYERPNGHDEFAEWLKDLPRKDKVKILKTIYDTENNGLLVAQRMSWVKKIDTEKNLYEVRSKVASNIQRAMYFHVEGARYVITHGFTKKTQKTPKTEIKRALQIRKEWENEQKN